jgi:hypothetical protein
MKGVQDFVQGEDTKLDFTIVSYQMHLGKA